MKRFWLILLSLGLIVAFSTSAMAVDVKFSGEFYAAGLYLDKTNFVKTNYTIPANPLAGSSAVPVNANNSTAFYFQRLRLTTDFIVSPGLTLSTRADIMERAWGATRSAANTATPLFNTVALDSLSAGTRAENENIAIDLLNVTYVSPIGLFQVGYVIDGAWGTTFGDSSMPTGRITYGIQYSGITAALMTGISRDGERSKTAINSTTASDRDQRFVTALVKYNAKNWEAGLLGKYIREAAFKYAPDVQPLIPFDIGFKVDNLAILPYAKAQFGPVAVQAEVNYLRGRLTWEGTQEFLVPLVSAGSNGLLPADNARIEQLAAYLDATADFGMFYGGGSLAYVSGDDPATTAIEGYHPLLTGLNGGLDWNPCLIMFNSSLSYWAGGQYGYDGSLNAGGMKNAYFAQLRAGVRPIDKVDIMLSGAWAHAVKTPTVAWENRTYGYEVDLTATYKITNNLSYMLGAGYLFTGNYFKGLTPTPPTAENEINNDFLVINKLTLTF